MWAQALARLFGFDDLFPLFSGWRLVHHMNGIYGRHFGTGLAFENGTGCKY